MIVAIDGPAGAGKSTVARLLASRLGLGYLNTGAMYRAVTLLALQAGLDVADGDALARLAAEHDIALRSDRGGEVVVIDGKDVSQAVREREVTGAVSAVASHRAVREQIVRAQRRILERGGWVADGRDIGSVVVPDADLKVYLTASPEERARRRHAEIVAGGDDIELGDVLQDIARRDELDTTRAESPLTVAPGAVVVDTSGMSIEAVVEHLAVLVEGSAS